MKTYEQEWNDLIQARVHSIYSAKKEEMILKDKPLFSKNQLDEVRKKLLYYFLLGIVVGSLFAWAICKILN